MCAASIDQWTKESLGFEFIPGTTGIMPTLLECGLKVLTTGDSHTKVLLTLEAFKAFENGSLPIGDVEVIESVRSTVPDSPARPNNLTVVQPGKTPKRGKAGSLKNRITLLHSLAHIESYAIDLSWDILVRFAEDALPREFYSDWLRIAADEARHFSIWNHRLIELGSHYGALPVHEGLWESATKTSYSLDARLAIVHMVHEARGLDVAPRTLQNLRNANDSRSADLLQVIYDDEVTHVAAAVKWFIYRTEQSSTSERVSYFHNIVRKDFCGNLKPPFNDEARAQAGFTAEWYEPLVLEE